MCKAILGNRFVDFKSCYFLLIVFYYFFLLTQLSVCMMISLTLYVYPSPEWADAGFSSQLVPQICCRNSCFIGSVMFLELERRCD